MDQTNDPGGLKLRKTRAAVFCILIVLGLTGATVFPRSAAFLPEINRPEFIEANSDELFIIEDAFVYVYSLKDYTFLRKIGKKGSGPSEFETNSYTRLRIQPFDDEIFLNTNLKIGVFTRDGQMKMERKLPYFAFRVSPLGNNYAVTRTITGPNGETMLGVMLVDSQLNDIATLYQRGYFDYTKASKFEIVPDFVYSRIYKGSLYVFDNRGDFVIRVFSPSGKPAGKIAVDYKKRKMTGEFKDKIKNWMAKDPMFKIMPDNYKKMFVFPDYFPVMRYFVVADDRVYVHTYKARGEKDEFVILDLKGKVLKRVFLRNITVNPLAPLSYTFYKGSYIYLLENEDPDKWELHIEKVF